MRDYIAGLILGLGLILPIGSQNVYVLKSALRIGFPRSLIIGLAAACCDTLLIVIGALGASKALQAAPMLRPVLLLAGSALLLYMGVKALMAKAPDDSVELGEESLQKAVIATVSASLLNPHAIIDTVGVIGLSISSAGSGATFFGLGAVSASIVWFCFLTLAGSLLASLFTPTVRLWLDRLSGVLLIGFAIRLACEMVFSR
jgi:L-lysine exporter family protein LysE/ArgO